MHFKLLTAPLLAASLPLVSAQLNKYAKEAGMMYFGAAIDAQGQRERAGLDAAYPKYLEIFGNNDEFGQTTPTNGMKWLFTEPERGVFNFTEGDIISSIAKEQGKILRCHALVWHSQLAPWVEAQTNWTKDEMREILTTHITAVAGHWKGQCYAWDVVNEGLNENGTYRDTLFYRILGEEYIKLAFQVAAKADPDAKLYYNDYNLESPSPKSQAARRIVQMLQKEGIKVDGVGMQAHFQAHAAPTLQQQIDVMKSYIQDGVEVALTELDVRIDLPLNDTNLAQQKAVYASAAAACAQVDKCVGITLWDFYDPFSWVPYVFSGQGNPLLWFEDFTKHSAYDGIIDALKADAAKTPAAPARRSMRTSPRS